MHYIVGTNFSVKPDPRRGFKSRENSFNANTLYRLSRISQQGTGLLYTFHGANNSVVELEFESSKDADALIAKIRGEALPAYDPERGKTDM
jgi:hypothetical protein